jgi:hypothetical protein
MLLASGRHPKDVLQLVIETDFAAKLTPNRWLPGRLLALLMKYRYEKTLPPRGAYGWRKMQELIDSQCPQWPKTFWTVAVCEHGQVVFTADGVMKYEKGGERRAISSPPLSVGLAVCATCAVPGIIDAVPFGGEHLFDGALSLDGQCPVEVVPRHFGHSLSQVIAFDVEEDDIKNSRWLRFLWNIFCGGDCGNFDGKHPVEKDGLIVINPEISGFHALQFNLSRDVKWRAVLDGFKATVSRLATSGLVEADKLASAIELARKLEEIERSAKKRGSLAAGIELILRSQGLF